MTLRTAAIAGLVIALVVAACGGGGPESNWERFVSEEGGYSFLAPHEPAVETVSEDSGFGIIDFTRYIMMVDGTLFVTFYTDLTPANLATYSADELVSFAAENLVETTAGRLISDEPISLGGAPGRETIVEADTGRIARGRVYQIGARQFQIFTVSDPDEQSSADVLMFLDSLRIE